MSTFQPKYPPGFVDALVEKSGKSSKTVYRKLREGWTEGEIVSGQRGVKPENYVPITLEQVATAEPDDEPTSEPANNDKLGLKWAEAVMWAADNIDTPKSKMSRKAAGNSLRYNLYLLGKENLRELHGNLVPKALSIIDKHKGHASDDTTAAEEAEIAELEGILKQAISESRSELLQYLEAG